MADLDGRQEAAVAAGPVDVFIAAGAGSGKTRVLSARFVSAVLGHPPYERTEPGRLLAVTFTEKAAGELSERVRGALLAAGDSRAARSIGDAWISTIHGMCSRILRRHALDAGLDPHFRVLDDVESSALEAEALEAAVHDSLDDEAFAQLLDAFGLPVVARAARTVSDSAHALGLELKDVTVVSDAEAWRVVQDATTELRGLADEFPGLGQSKTVLANGAAVRSLADTLQASRTTAEGGLETALAATDACRPRRLGGAELHNEVVDACKEHIALARAGIAQLLAGRLEQALLAFASAFTGHYGALKRQRGALDFEDLQLMTAALLSAHPRIAERYREHFAMIMLDESQDTNELQLRIIEKLSRENLCTVGDENQSIYAFRHADVRVFRERESRVACRHALDTNYRTAPPLLAAVNGLFSQPGLLGESFMRLRAPDEAAVTHEGADPLFEVRFVDGASIASEDAQETDAAIIAERVVELLGRGIEPGAIAVLMRALSGGRAAKVEAALRARGVPSFIASGGSFFEQPEVAEARALLAVTSNVWDDAALTVVLAGRLTGLGADALVTLRAHADSLALARGLRPRDAHLWDAAVDPDAPLAEEEAAALARTVAVIERARALRGARPLVDTVLEPLLELDADLVLLASGSGGARAWANLQKLGRMAAEYETGTAGDLGGFLEYLDLREMHATSEQEATLDGESGAVRVMSIHAAKGLEFPHVIVAGLSGASDRGAIAFGPVDGAPLLGVKYPGPDGWVATLGWERVNASMRAAEDAETVRLLYVACTRAEEGLTLIGRSDPAKEAKRSLTDLVRTALGFGEADTLAEGDVALGEGIVRIRVVREEPSEPQPHEHPGQRDSAAEGDVVPPELPTPPTHSAPERVSYTGLATYQRCPYRYYLTSVIGLPAPPAQRGGEALAFGNAVHAVLERLASPADDPAPLIETAAAAAGLDHGGRGRLVEAVRSYLRMDVAAEVFGHEQVMREVPIAVPLGDTILVGAIDVLARSGPNALVVDYKTGTGTLDADEAHTRYRLQGECYALAAFAAGASRVRVVFAEIERSRETSFEYALGDAAAVEADVRTIVKGMAEGAFGPRESYDPQLCETCPGLGSMCPVSRPSRGGAA